jgi:hypothetical protein
LSGKIFGHEIFYPGKFPGPGKRFTPEHPLLIIAQSSPGAREFLRLKFFEAQIFRDQNFFGQEFFGREIFAGRKWGWVMAGRNRD